MREIYTRLIKAITGNNSTALIIKPTPGKRVHAFQLQLTYAGGTNTLAALMTALTKIVVKVGTTPKWTLTGTQLRDFVLLYGLTFDFNGLPNTGAQVTIPLAPEWFDDVVANSLAWNPARLGGDITLELTSAVALTCVAYEVVSDDLDAPSSGILTLEEIKPVAGGVQFFTGNELELRGDLVSASIYPDTTNNNEITPASLLLGMDDVPAHDDLTSAQNDERLERKGLTPSAAGRTANIYDIVSVTDNVLALAWMLRGRGKARLKISAAAAMAGTCSVVLCRLEPR